MKNLLVLTAVSERFNPLVAKWAEVVESEGDFIPDVRYLGAKSSRELMEYIHSESPDAVQLIGRAPMFGTGFTAYDGHESRCVWTDVPYTGVFIQSKLSDSKSNPFLRTTPEPYRNVEGDGRYDNIFGGKALWPVGRIDFSRMPAFNTSMRRPDGKVCWPAIDEDAATEGYFARNLAYRTSGPAKTEGHVCGGNFTAANMNALKARAPEWSWNYWTSGSKIAGRFVSGFVYGSLGSRYWYKYECGGSMLAAFWHNCFSSKQYEFLHDGAGIRRSLTWALVSTWGYGSATWSPTSSDRTVYDVCRSSWGRYNSMPLYASLCGDVTLRLPHAR